MAGVDSYRVVFLGPPGSGKGTQASLLSGRLGVPAISTGDMLRRAVAEGTEIGRRVDAVMAAGALVGDELMAEIVCDRLAKSDAAAGFLLDGYPRTSSQAATLDDVLGSSASQLDHVVFIDAPEDTLVARALSRQRDDDVEEVIRERLRVYREKTRPLVDAYRSRGLLREIAGDRTIEEVASSILQAVAS